MSAYKLLTSELASEPRAWLITGVAGFIGSNLLETLLKLEQSVVGLDNFSTGRPENLREVKALVSPRQWERFRLIAGDISDLEICERACADADYILHQAALGSVPRSLADPVGCHRSNVTGFLNMLIAARQAKARRFVFASSSSVYGDDPALPRAEEQLGNCLSPYAVSKRVNELYADAFSKCYGMEYIGLR